MQPKNESAYQSNFLGFDRVENCGPAELRPAKLRETDPHGKSLNEAGAKADAGKVRPALVLGEFARALLEVSEVGTLGAKKYTDRGWVQVLDGVHRYDDAMLRHWLKEKSGELLDQDTRRLHAAHVAWNALARLDLMIRAKGENK